MSTRLKYALAAVALIGFGAVSAIVAAHLHFPPKADDAPAVKPDPAKPAWFGGVLYPRDGSHRRLIGSMPRFAAMAPHLMRSGTPPDRSAVLLYKAWTDLFAGFPPYIPQQVGDCTSFGGGHALDLLQCVEWCLASPGKRPTPADIQETDTEALYGLARETAGMLGEASDGCYGGAVVKAMQDSGVVSRRMLGTAGAYSGRRARSWGRRGVPGQVKQLAARFKLGAAAQVTTWDELVSAVSAGHPVIICTQSGFELQRDPQGFAKQLKCWPSPVGCGGHCMFIAAVRFDRPGACIIQSWGPDTPTGPTSLDQPSFSFWADRSAVESVLSEGDSWAISRAPRFGAAGQAGRSLPTHWRKSA